jgi:hypothetical protein
MKQESCLIQKKTQSVVQYLPALQKEEALKFICYGFVKAILFHSEVLPSVRL